MYGFNSRTDIQQWAQGGSPIPTPDELGRINVPQLDAGASATVSLDIPADQAHLKALATWGPKPLLIEYNNQQGQMSQAHTFMTRSSDGLDTAGTPALDITVAMPLVSNSWQINTTMMKKLLTDGEQSSDSDTTASSATTDGSDTADGSAPNPSSDSSTSSTTSSSTPTSTSQTMQSVVSLAGDASKLSRASAELITKHPKLQVIADPTYLDALSMPPQVSGIMQPGYFDINAYTDKADAAAYSNAGVTLDAWNSATGLSQYRAAIGDATATKTTYAWQGTGRWTLSALAQAKQQGYDIVIAGSNFDSSDTPTVHTNKYVVPTDAGEVTVLAAQKELSNLAKGKATSKQADSEQSSAGRLSRFMAQSAFYQMEQPYTTRNLLICFGANTAASDENALMSAMESASWLNITDLNTLANAEPYMSGEDARQVVADNAAIPTKQQQARDASVQQLTADKTDITRFGSSILSDCTTAQSSQTREPSSRSEQSSSSTEDSQQGMSTSSDKTDNSADPSAVPSSISPSGDTSSGNSPSAGSDDVQALARQDAKASRSVDGTAWIADITDIHDALALHALSGSTSLRSTMTDAANTLSHQLMSSVSITATEKITVVSETASMPVTINNSGPYPVRVRVSSLTDSMEIVTGRIAEVAVPARGNAQATFTIRVSTSGSTTAHLNLLDRKGVQFSTAQTTPITSTLQISDMSGFIFIAVAVVLGIFGLWRQFHRKKDPDE
jgi:hypothetical protein